MCPRGELLSALLDLLYPPRCAGCDAAGAWLCAACRAGRASPRSPRPRHVRSLDALGRFEGPLRRAVHRFKYEREAVVADALGSDLGDLVARGLALGWRVDALVPVPLAPRRVRERGFDQADLLARAASRRSGVVRRRALRRVRETPSQVGLGRRERAANVAAAFAGQSIRGAVVLVDDVITTGSTLSECARTLRRAGASEVRAVVVAVEE